MVSEWCRILSIHSIKQSIAPHIILVATINSSDVAAVNEHYSGYSEIIANLKRGILTKKPSSVRSQTTTLCEVAGLVFGHVRTALRGVGIAALTFGTDNLKRISWTDSVFEAP